VAEISHVQHTRRVPLTLDSHLARIPELGTQPRHAFALFEIGASRQSDEKPLSDIDRSADEAARPNTRAPIFLALAIDASSSMRGPRFALAVQAARDLVDSLTPADRVAVVTFAQHAALVLPPTSIDEEGKLEAHRVLDRLTTGQGTNMSAGWREAADAMSRLMLPDTARRIVLLTDGLPSQGEKDPAALARMVSEGRQRGLETSAVGIGDGIDEKLCASLARSGDGRFYYVRNETLIGDVVAHEVEGARRLAATDTMLVLAFSPRVERAEVMHRFHCHTEGRTMEVRLGAVSYQMPRTVLVQFDVQDPKSDAVLGAAVAKGKAVIERQMVPTMEGYALGARSAGTDAAE
jgi:Ca-activated chloride channel family protein